MTISLRVLFFLSLVSLWSSCSDRVSVIGMDFAKSGALATPAKPTDYVSCDFSNLSLLNQDLSGSTFKGCKFVRTDLSGCVLVGASFLDCEMTESQWMGADCRRMDLSASILTGARWRSTYLPDSTISNAQVASLGAASSYTIVPEANRAALQQVLKSMEARRKSATQSGNPFLDLFPIVAEEGYRKKLENRLADEKNKNK